MKVEKQTILALLFICFIAHGTCHKNPTAPKTGTLTGTVYLEGEQDHSGINVALYKLAELDTTILRYNREYPNVGFFTCRLFGRFTCRVFGRPISPATEFVYPPTFFGRACPPGVWRNHRLGEVIAEMSNVECKCTKLGNWHEKLTKELFCTKLKKM